MFKHIMTFNISTQLVLTFVITISFFRRNYKRSCLLYQMKKIDHFAEYLGYFFTKFKPIQFSLQTDARLVDYYS